MKEAISRIESYCGDVDCQRGMRNILHECKMLRETYSEDGWRDARKELPNEGELVLVYDNDGSMYMCHYSLNVFRTPKQSGEVIAWRPLPDPPAFA